MKGEGIWGGIRKSNKWRSGVYARCKQIIRYNVLPFYQQPVQFPCSKPSGSLCVRLKRESWPLTAAMAALPVIYSSLKYALPIQTFLLCALLIITNSKSTCFSLFVHLCVFSPLSSFLISTDWELGFFRIQYRVTSHDRKQPGNSDGLETHLRVLSRFSLVQLCDPRDCSLSGSSVHGIFQA